MPPGRGKAGRWSDLSISFGLCTVAQDRVQAQDWAQFVCRCGLEEAGDRAASELDDDAR
jgi:hypothetical protein